MKNYLTKVAWTVLGAMALTFFVLYSVDVSAVDGDISQIGGNKWFLIWVAPLVVWIYWTGAVLFPEPKKKKK